MKKFKNLFVILTICFLFTPIVILILFSFNKSSLNIVFDGFTTYWYRDLFHNRDLLEAFFNTIIIAFGSTIISVIIGTISAVALYKYNFKGEKIINYLLYIPIIIPEIVLGISLLSVYTLCKLELSMWTILLSHIVFSIPFVVVSIRGVLNEMGKEVLEASSDLGASELQTFFYVILPSIKEGIKSGALLTLTLSLDDVVISYFTAGPGSNTLPLKIYSMIKVGITPSVYALMTLMMLIVIIIMTLNSLIQMRKLRGVKQ